MSKDQAEGEPHRERDRRRRDAAGGRQQAEDKNYFRDHAGQKPEAVEIPRLATVSYAAAPFRKDWIASSSLSNTSKIVRSLVTCSRSPTRCVRLDSLMAPPTL